MVSPGASPGSASDGDAAEVSVSDDDQEKVLAPGGEPVDSVDSGSESPPVDLLAPFKPLEDPKKSIDWWVIQLIGLCGVLGVIAALLLLRLPMAGDPRVYVEVWSDGIVLSPKMETDLVEWVRPLGAIDDLGRPFSGIDIGLDTLGMVYERLAGTSAADSLVRARGDVLTGTGGLVRSFRLNGDCVVRIGQVEDSQLEFRVQRLSDADATCEISAELDPPIARPDDDDVDEVDDVWGSAPFPSITVEPRELGVSAEPAVLRFRPDPSLLPITVGRFPIQGVSFAAATGPSSPSMIRAGVMRLPDFTSDGEDQVVVMDRVVGRGHPLQMGDRIAFGNLREGEILRLEIDQLIHAQITGKATAPAIQGVDHQPRVLEHLNTDGRLLWALTLAVGAMGIAATALTASR